MRRGDVFRLRLKRGTGHEQHGARFCVVVQSDAMLTLSTVLVAPTSTVARPASFRPEIHIGRQPTRVLVEQTGAVDISRLGTQVGRISTQERWALDMALTTVLDLR